MTATKDKKLYASLMMMILLTNPCIILGDDTFCTDTWSNIYFNDYIGAALQNNGSLVSWGVNQFGGLGTAPPGTIQSTPVQVYAYYANWTQISLNEYYTIGLGHDHYVYGWGSNVYGNLGPTIPLGSVEYTANSSSQITSVGECSFVATHGLQYTTYVINLNGTLYGFGDNSHAQLGVATTSKPYSATALQIGSDNNWASVFPAKRDSHVCGLKVNGNLYCWGENYLSQVGDGTTTDRASPLLIGSSNDKWTSVAPQLHFTIALHSNGTLWAFGNTFYGVFADGNNYSYYSTPTHIAVNLTFKAIAVYDNYIIAIASDGTLYGWGSNLYTQVNSNPAVGIQNTPNQIDNSNSWASVYVSVGYNMNAIGSAFGIKTNGNLYAWGSNDNGQLGLGIANVTVAHPTQVMQGTTFSLVASVGYVTGVIDTSGEIYVTGFNNFDLLGDGSINPSNTFHSCENRNQVCANHLCHSRLLRN